MKSRLLLKRSKLASRKSVSYTKKKKKVMPIGLLLMHLVSEMQKVSGGEDNTAMTVTLLAAAISALPLLTLHLNTVPRKLVHFSTL